MTAYTLAADATLRDIGNAAIWGVATARSGGDTIDLNGFTFVQDQDSRYGFSGASTYTWGNITINANKGGKWVIDATKVWMIPFTGGSGTLTLGTAVTIGSATGNTIGIYTALNVAPATTGASGWLKITNVSGSIPSSGTYTQAGFTFTVSGPAIRGFIEVNGDEAAGVIANRLGAFEMRGAWFEVGTTSGSSATTYQLPTNGSVQYYPAVFVDSDAVTVTGASWSGGVATYTCSGHTFVPGDEVTVTGATPSGYNVTDAVITQTTPTTFSIALASDPGAWVSGGSAVVPEPYPCAGSLVAASSTATDAVRGKVCWASTAGVLRFGSDGTNTVGYVPPAGRRIRIPNILTANNTTAARGTNALPNATLATRYDFTTTGGGVVFIDKAFLNWYPSCSQAFSVTMKYAAIAEQLRLSEVSQAMTIVRCAVGQSAAQAQFGLSLASCYAGGYFGGCVFTAASLAASGRYVSSISDCFGFTFERCREYSFVLRANATTGAALISRCTDFTFRNAVIGSGRHAIVTCNNFTYKDTVYFDAQTTTGTANPMAVWDLSAVTQNCLFDGVTFGGLTNVQPYSALLQISAAGCSNVTLRNVGTSPSAPLSLGSTNAAGYALFIASGGAAFNVRMQRVFVSNTRANLYGGDNSTSGVQIDNCYGDFADVPVNNMLNMLSRGVGSTPTYAAQQAVYGTHWFDHFTSTTVGRIAVLMNEPTARTVSQVTLENGAAFTSAGGLYMPTIGMRATFEMPYFALGHTGFSNTALVMAGGTAGNYTYAYQINTGAGWSNWSSELTAAELGSSLNGLGSIDPATGFKLKLRITTSTANTTAITSVYVTTTSSSAAQLNYYPLDLAPLSLTGLVPGSDVVVLAAGTETVVVDVDANPTSVCSLAIDTGAFPFIDVCIYKTGYVPLTIRNLALPSTGATLPIAQVADRNYSNP